MNKEPAFPVEMIYTQENEKFNGMTLRDYFAAKAMQVLMTETDGINDDNPGSPRWQSNTVAELAYEQADAMMIERDKNET